MKLYSLLAVYLGITASVAANCQVATPSVGYVRYADGVVRPIYGLQGNYIVGDGVFSSAEAASFSEAGGLISKEGSLVLVDSKLAAVATAELRESGALLRLDGALDTAIAWLPESRVLLHWTGKSFAAASVSFIAEGDKVTSIRKLDANTGSLLVAKPDTTLVRYGFSLRNGELQSSVPLPATCNSAWDGGTRLICLSDRKLSLVSPAGDILQALPLPVDGSLAVEQAGTRCLHLSGRTPGENWLLHLDDKDLQLYQLPGPKANAKTAQ
jgi:hypothetical protein